MVAVAEAAKVSYSFTVSAVINGTSVVSEELRLRVEAAIRSTGYKRNAVARSLKTGRTQTVGVVIGDITNPFYTEVVAAIQQVLYRAGYGVMLCCNDRNVTLQRDHIAVLHDRMVDGLIIAPTGDDEQLRTAARADPSAGGADRPHPRRARVRCGGHRQPFGGDRRHALSSQPRPSPHRLRRWHVRELHRPRAPRRLPRRTRRERRRLRARPGAARQFPHRRRLQRDAAADDAAQPADRDLFRPTI